jgi:hypothetical protein
MDTTTSLLEAASLDCMSSIVQFLRGHSYALGFFGILGLLLTFTDIAVEYICRGDASRSRVAKAKLVWRVAVLLPYLGLVAYLVVAGDGIVKFTRPQSSINFVHFINILLILILFLLLSLLAAVLLLVIPIKQWTTRQRHNNSDYFRMLLEDTVSKGKKAIYNIVVSERKAILSPPEKSEDRFLQVDIDEVHCLAALFNGLVDSRLLGAEPEDKIQVVHASWATVGKDETPPAMDSPGSCALIGSPVNNDCARWLCELLATDQQMRAAGLEFSMCTCDDCVRDQKLRLATDYDQGQTNLAKAHLHCHLSPEFGPHTYFHLIPSRISNGDPKQGQNADPKQGQNADPKQGQNADPKQGQNADPKQEQWLDYALIAKLPRKLKHSDRDTTHSVLLLAGCKAGGTFALMKLLSDLSRIQNLECRHPPRIQTQGGNRPLTHVGGTLDGMYQKCDRRAGNIDISTFFYCIYQVKYTKVEGGVPKIDEAEYLCGRNLDFKGNK